MVEEGNKDKSESEPQVDSVEKTEDPIEPPKPEAQASESPKPEPIKLEPLKPTFNKPAVICIGEYPIKILLKGSLAEKKDEPRPIFIDKFSADIAEWSQSSLDPDSILGLDLKIDTHFWVTKTKVMPVWR